MSSVYDDLLQFVFSGTLLHWEPGVAYWLRRCATSRTVPGSIHGGVTGFFSDIFRPYHGSGVDSAPSENEHQEHFLGVKAVGA